MNTEISKIVVIGISHKTSTVSEREKFQINKKELHNALDYFKTRNEVEGTVIISTCNRLEFYFVIKPNVNPFSIVNEFYCDNGFINAPLNQNIFYKYNGIEAVKHLFRVVAGLDSMLMGEYQIQGQIKDAYSLACSISTADKILHKLFHAAFRTGKAVRNKTSVGSCNQSLSGVAFKIINERLRKEDVITIVGVNQNTKIIAEKLNRSGFSHLIFVNRTLHKAEELADKYNGVAFSLDYIEEPMISSKCVFTCTGAPGYIINSEMINKIYMKVKLPKLLIDMAVPHDINITGLCEDIELIDIEGLKKYLNEQKKETALELPEAEKIISNEASVFEAWSESDSAICSNQLNEKIETIRLQLLDDIKLQFSRDEFELLDKFSRTFLHRIKPIIISEIKTTKTDMEINQEAR